MPNRCNHAGCTSQPVFNIQGQKRGIFCSVHKLDGMVDVMTRRCEYAGCTTQPTFNIQGQNRGIFCSKHKSVTMVDIRSKRCEYAGCTTVPTFNIEGEKKAIMCATHKSANMIDVRSKRCEFAGCMLQPAYNIEGEKKAIMCTTHKSANMIDVKNKQCNHAGCKTSAWYGIPGNAPTLCAVHKKVGTMPHPNRFCGEKRCREVATHGITAPARCEQHMLPGDDNLVERECVNCHLPNVLNSDGLCADCSAWTSGKRPRLAKQREVLQFLDHCFTEFPYDTTDVVPQDLKDCDRRERPDVMWDRADRIVILEVDEDQHKSRPCECEQTRMMNVSQALGSEKTVWIRYNPDSFKSPESRRWSSRAKRHDVLKRWLTWSLTEASLPYTISVVYLFFDGFSEGSVQVEQFL